MSVLIAIGSGVRGVHHSRSDVDFLVLCDGDYKKPPRAPADIDLRAYKVSTAEERISGGHDLLGWAVQFGVPLIDRRNIWARIVSRWRNKLPMPSSEECRRRAARARSSAKDLLDAGDKDAGLEQALTMMTHLSRAALIDAGVYPASRPELPGQLRAIRNPQLAQRMDSVLRGKLPMDLLR